MPDLRPYERVLALLDFDEHDALTAQKALLLARLSQAQLGFLHLIEPDGMLDGGFAGAGPQATAHSLEAAAVRRLRFQASMAGATESTCLALHGPLRQRFEEHVREWQPDLVVAGRHRAFLNGSHDVLILSSRTRTDGGSLIGRLWSRFVSLNCFVGI